MSLRQIGWGAVVVAILLFLWVQWDARRTGAQDVVFDGAQAALHTHHAYQTRQDKLQAVTQRAIGRATVAIASDHAKDSAIRFLHVQLAVAATDSQRVVILREAVDTLTAQRDSARSAVAGLLLAHVADSTGRSEAQQRVAELERHLANVLTVADCHVLGLGFLPRCPSRNLSAGLGLTVGVLGTLVLKH